jgi:hypothetical protein
MHLKQSKSLGEGMDQLVRVLSTLYEDYIHALKKRKEICERVVEGMFKEPLNDCIQCIKEVFLLHIEGSSSTDINDLE